MGALWRIKEAERVYKKAGEWSATPCAQFLADAGATAKKGETSLWYIVEAVCKKYPNNEAIWSRTGCYTFAELHDRSANYAQFFLDRGVKPGDLVAFYLQNSPEFIFAWIGAMCISAAPAFLNYNLEGAALLHCLNVCQANLLLVDEDPAVQQRIEKSKAEIEKGGVKTIVLTKSLKDEIANKKVAVPPDHLRRGKDPKFPAALIYTR